MEEPRLITATGRELGNEEVAFLAWFFIACGRRDVEHGLRPDGLAMIAEWEEMTGQELPDDFLHEVVAVYDAQ